MPAVLLEKKDITENPRPVEPEVTDNENAQAEVSHTHKAAFLVLVDNQGNFVFEPDINKPVIPERPVNQAEVKQALAALLDEIRLQETAILTAQAVVNMQMQMARQIQEQQQNQAILQQMGRNPLK